MKPFLFASLAVSALAVAGCLCALILTVRTEIPAMRTNALAEIHAQAIGLRTDAKEQLGAIREQSLARLDTLTALADRQLTDLKQAVVVSVSAAVAPLEGIRADLKPVLVNAAALTAKADQSIDPADVQGVVRDARFFLARGSRAAGHVEQMASAIEKETPDTAKAVREGTQQFAGIATDAHTLTTKFTAPESLRTKIWNAIKSVVLIAGKF